MQFQKTIYTLFVCVGIIFFISFIGVHNQEKWTTSGQQASVVSSFISFFSGNASNQRQLAPSQMGGNVGKIIPPPPGTFDGMACKESACNTGSSNPITITNGGLLDWDGTWPESMEKLFKDALTKKDELKTWLTSKCNEPGCIRKETGPDITIRMRPKNPNIGSCKVTNTRTVNLTGVATKTTSCDDAKAEALKGLGKQMQELPDPCPSCGYGWTIKKLEVDCTQSPPPVKYKATARAEVTSVCTDKSSTDEYEGWIEWNACYCCQVVSPPTQPPQPKQIQSITPPAKVEAI